MTLEQEDIPDELPEPLANEAIVTAESANPKPDNGENSGEPEVTAEQKAAKTDDVLLRAFERQIMPPSLDAIKKDAWTSDEDVPDYVVDAVEDAFDGGGIFDRFASISGRVADTIGDTLQDALTQPQGWSLDSMVDRLSDELPRADPVDLETIARTESASVLNDARESGYRDRGLDDAKFYWQGPDDSRTTDACEELKDETNPSYGGTPVTLAKLVTKERDVHGKHFKNLEFRKHVIHPNERHTFVRESGTGRGDEPDVDIDVDVPGADAFDPEDAPASPAEMSKSHGEDYGDVVDRVAKATNVTRRVGQIEDALGSPLPVVLRECLESAGSTRGAHKELNRRLSDTDGWNVDEHGQVSTATIYEWVDRYEGHVDHLV